ncbi:GNAT family N-acetyltransferase [Halovivax limisalsi]|uniref:GNAT family N-acetyltransferase n=1 Tax=Halovivax limisalsi TaxID=1453760 RepID=UPI001FFD8AE7|nr:GNAT family protein [Halovivax limisalsi]
MTDLFPETIRTERLRLELLHPETVDLLELYEAAGTRPDVEEVTRYLTWDAHQTPKDTLEFVEFAGEQYDEGDGATYVVRPREGEDGAGTLAGAAGCSVEWDRRTMVLGTWLSKPFWGRGYSGERAAAMLELAFDRLDLELVAVTAHVDNEKSNRAIEKYVEAHGGRREGTLRNWHTFDGEPAAVNRYSVSKDEWDANRSDGEVAFDD